MENVYLQIRKFIGCLGCLLPFICIASSFFSENTSHQGWWYSISITYYSSPAMIIILSVAGFLLICYRSYSVLDGVITSIAGFSCLGIVVFPCPCDWFPLSAKIGLFRLTSDISSVFHLIFSALCLFSLSFNNLFLFTRSGNPKKNKIYRNCGIFMLINSLMFVLNYLLPIPKFMIIFWEGAMILAFGFCWMIKGHIFDRILDK